MRTTLESYAYTALRVVTGLLFLFHGLQKLFGMYGGQVAPMGSLFWVAGVLELAGGLLIMVGLMTSIVAFLLSGEMAVAYFKVHLPQAFWPIENQGELAALYCFIFLFIATRGPGMFSLDRAFGRSDRRQT
ncbi:MAG TPA: DoxX family protein [Vicinamibacterales bacterium]